MKSEIYFYKIQLICVEMASKMIWDSNPDFRTDPNSDPDVYRIVVKMLWIHFAECR